MTAPPVPLTAATAHSMQYSQALGSHTD
jgi:hypothetical protein